MFWYFVDRNHNILRKQKEKIDSDKISRRFSKYPVQNITATLMYMNRNLNNVQEIGVEYLNPSQLGRVNE